MSENTAVSKQQQQRGGAIAIAEPRLPYHPAIEERFGVTKSDWKALTEAIFPNAASADSVIMALSYCRARKLDIFKRPVHIVPIWSKELGRMVDTVWPGIGELRTTASRTGSYAGLSPVQYGPTIEEQVGKINVRYPEWAQVTVYRIVQWVRVEFCGPQVFWMETYAESGRNDPSPNSMWATRPFGQIAKCAEAAALRAAFPEEIGSDYCSDEVGHIGRTVESTAKTLSSPATQLPGMTQSDRLASQLEANRQQRSTEPVHREPEQHHESAAETTVETREPGDEDGQSPDVTRDALLKQCKEATTIAHLQVIGKLVDKLPDSDRNDVYTALEERAAAIKAEKAKK